MFFKAFSFAHKEKKARRNQFSWGKFTQDFASIRWKINSLLAKLIMNVFKKYIIYCILFFLFCIILYLYFLFKWHKIPSPLSSSLATKVLKAVKTCLLALQSTSIPWKVVLTFLLLAFYSLATTVWKRILKIKLAVFIRGNYQLW